MLWLLGRDLLLVEAASRNDRHKRFLRLLLLDTTSHHRLRVGSLLSRSCDLSGSLLSRS